MSTEVELLRQIQDKFIAQRTQQELEIQAWANKARKLPDNIREELGIEEKHYSLRTMIPELYVENPDKDIYEEQYSEAQLFYQKVNDYADKVNKEALQCLSQFQELSNR